jgi:hypothetical protein
MDPVHVHLALNHVPVIGIGFGLLLLIAAIVRGNEESQRFALGAFILVALLTLVVYFTGEPTEEAVEHLPGVSESMIDHHKQVATISLAGTLIVGAASLVGLLGFARTRLPRWFVGVVLVLALTGQGLMVWTGNTGGQIRHSEIRAGTAAPGSAPTEGVERRQD